MLRNKRKLSILALAAIAGLGTASQVTAGPQLYWNLNGSPVTDGSGNGNGGTVGSGVTFSAPTLATGLSSSSSSLVANFNGTGAITSSATSATLDIDGNKPKSISVWVDAATASWAGQGGPFEIGADANGQDFSLRVKSTGNGDNGNVGDWRAQFWGGDVDFTVANSADHWVHFVMIYDPSSSVYAHKETIYANNSVIASGDFTLATATSPKNFAVGQWTNNGTPSYLIGAVDDVAVYDSVLTAANVNSLFNGTSPTSVPEPSCVGILAGGTVLSLLRRRRNCNSQR